MVAPTNTPMRLNPNSSGLKTGVYAIRNRVNGKVYVGSAAVSFGHRWRVHKKQLEENRHHSKSLQRDWNEHGDEVFEFSVICTCIPSQCVAMEQIYIDENKACDPAFGYNAAPVAGSTLGYKHTEESRSKMRESSKKRVRTSEEIERLRSYGKSKAGLPNPGTALYWKNPRPDHVAKRQRGANTPEANAKKSAAMMGRVMPFDTRAKISSKLKGRVFSEETRSKMRASSKLRFARPEEVAKAKAAGAIGLASRWRNKKIQ